MMRVTTTQVDTQPLGDATTYIKRVLNRLYTEPGSAVEVRCLHTRWGTISGYFDDFAKLAENAAELSGEVPAVYVTLNPVNPALLARANNRVEKYAKTTSSDGDIIKRCWFPVDFDPARPTDISSTDAEKALAIERAKQCRAWLTTLNFPAGMFADSGNGAHLLYRIDLPNDSESSTLIQKCLNAVAARFTDDKVSVDLKNFNAARIWKLYGTLACKGDDMPDRPHRLAKILEGKSLGIVSLELLQKLAALAPEPEKYHSAGNGHYHSFDLDDFITRHAIAVKRESAWNSGRRLILEICPWNADHSRGEAYIVQMASGAIGAGCHHNGCSGKGWAELREIYEPGFLDRRASAKYPPLNRQPGSEPVQATNAVLLKLSDVVPKKLRWLWHSRIPLGKVTVLDGDPGLGKSLISIDIAASLSKGKPMPNAATFDLEPAGAVFLSAEDDPEDTIQPRLALLGADLARMVLLQAVKHEDGLSSFPTIADLNAIREGIKEVGAKLVVIDPLMAYLPAETNSYRDQDIRRSLAPLAALAAELDVAVLVIRHLNKTSNNNPIYRGGGSIGIIGAARSGLMVAKDPDDDSRCILSVAKSNLAKLPASLAYRIMSNPAEIPFIDWLGATQHTASSLLNDQADTQEERSAVKDAEEFLRDFLKTGPRKVKDIFNAAKPGISQRSLERAKFSTGVKSEKSAFDDGWVWRLTKAANEDGRPPTKTEDRQSESL